MDENFNQITAYEKRMFFFIEEQNWTKASEYSEKILDIQPENGNAYLAKLLIDFRCTSIIDLSNLKTPFDNNINYKRTIQFGDNEIIDKINNSLYIINERNKQKKIETEAKNKVRKKRTKSALKIVIPICVCCATAVIIFFSAIQPRIKYNNALSLYEDGKYQEAYDIFSDLNFKDSWEKSKELKKIIEEKNYITYKNLLIKIPKYYDITIKVENGKLYIIGDFNCSIDSFLSYINPPSGYRFCNPKEYEHNNGIEFLIRNYTNVMNTKLYTNSEWKQERLDLLLYYTDLINGYSCRGQYINKNGQAPAVCRGTEMSSISFYNMLRSNFSFKEETIIEGQYSLTGKPIDPITFELTIVIQK